MKDPKNWWVGHFYADKAGVQRALGGAAALLFLISLGYFVFSSTIRRLQWAVSFVGSSYHGDQTQHAQTPAP